MICLALFGINIKIDGVSEPLFAPSIYCFMYKVLHLNLGRMFVEDP